ncbi:uncharacterized protein LOC107827161 isoform X1 [Nicotiana tabacum]|uniref:Uncharacterized protein LOC107827161 isoform X1 n=2 Tax=Nicotiana tabacum TaxID=4097 RepID=A0AC58TIQ9_TOBAC
MIIVYITFFYLLSGSYTNTILNIYFIGLFYALPDIGTRYICASLCIAMLIQLLNYPTLQVFFLVNIVLFTLTNCIYRNETCSNTKCWILCLFDFVSRTNYVNSEIPYNVNEGIPEKGLPKMGQNKLLFCASISFSAEELRRLTMAEGKVDKDSTGEVLDKGFLYLDSVTCISLSSLWHDQERLKNQGCREWNQ